MWNYLLVLLLIVFGSLYFIELGFGVLLGGRISDLLANLFAALIVVLIIDRIVRRSELQKKESVLEYVRRSVGENLSNLILGMQPPEDWKRRLKGGVPIETAWNNFFNRVWNVKENNLNSLQRLLEAYHNMIEEEELTEDIFEMISILKDHLWVLIDPSIRGKGRDIMDLSQISSETNTVIQHAKDTIERHKLLEYSVARARTWSKGEPTKFMLVRVRRKDAYSLYEKIVKESIEFRDACEDAWIKSKKKP